MSTVNSDVYSTGKAEKITIEKSIDEIRKGNGYFVSSLITAAAGIRSYTFIWPLKSTIAYHVTFKYSAYPQCEVYIYEGTGSTTTGSVGTAIVPYNMNRNEATGSLKVVQGITTGAGGTGSQLYSSYLPDWSTQKFGSSEARQNEIIIKNNTPYLLCFSGSAAGRISYEIYWYEQ